MTRPRLAALISATLASAAAFLVVSRWGLLGTVTGAAVIPLVYTLVSHWAAEGLEHLGIWMRRRVLRHDGVDAVTGDAGDAATGLVPADSATSGSATVNLQAPTDPPVATDAAAGGRPPKRGPSKIQWSVAAFASLALATSIYAVAVSGPAETTILRERVVEKVVTITVPGTPIAAQVSNADASTKTTVPQDPTTASTEPVGTTSTEVAPGTVTPSTTADTGQEPPVSTTDTAPATTTTSLP